MKKRQKIRKLIIIISFILFPITMFYLSPALIVMGASQGIIAGSFISFGLMFIVSLFFGRVFCGWLCPGAGLQEICFAISDRRIKKGNIIKFIIWAPWLSAILILLVRAGSPLRIDPLFQIAGGISISEPAHYIVYYSFIFLIGALSVSVGRRSFCHHVCWMAPFMITGRTLRNIFKWPSLQLKADSAGCAHCHSCTENCPMSLDVEEMVANMKMENPECILCGTCADNCTNSVITFSMRQHLRIAQ